MKHLSRLRTQGLALACIAITALIGAATERGDAAGVDLPISVSITRDIPETVAPGRKVAYEVAISNSGAHNPVTDVQLTLSANSCTFAQNGVCTTDVADGTNATVDTTPPTFYYTNDTLTCSGAGTATATCSLGTLQPDTTRTVTIVFLAPSSAPALGSTYGAGLNALALASGNETFNDNPDRSSHGDTTPDVETTRLRNTDYDGGFIERGNGLSLSTGTVASSTIHNTTQVTVPTVPGTLAAPGILAKLDEQADSSGCAAGISCFGQTVYLDVGPNFVFTNAAIAGVFRADASDVPAGVTVKNARLLHNGKLVPSAALCGTTLDPAVYDTSGACLVVTGSPPCTTAAIVKERDKDLTMCVSTPSNGTWKFGG